jgi:hypothetical protein
MTRRLVALVGLIACFAAGGEAQAHFLFVRVQPAAEGGRFAEAYFSEQAEAGDPRFVAKIAQTSLWSQTTPGEFRPLKVHRGIDRLRAHVPATGSVVVVGTCTYGVLGRAGETPFLLRHNPKAAAGEAEELNRMAPKGDLPLEVVARFEEARVHLSALRAGKPMPGIVFHIIDADLVEEKVTAGSDGQASWAPKAPGRYSAYVRHDTKVNGESGGKRYEEIRDFATIAFDWPLEPTGADPEAVSLFREALAARAQWSSFPGFTAKVAGQLDGAAFEGRVSVGADGRVTSEEIDGAAKEWVEDQLGSLARHRLAEAHQPDDPVLRFARPDDDHPLGPLLVFEGGQFATSYRVQDRQITVVNRHVGGRDMTITTLANERNGEGRFLPRCYVVQSWDGATGDLRSVETVRVGWERVGAFDLPAKLTVTSASGSGLSVRDLEITEHAMGKGAEAP